MSRSNLLMDEAWSAIEAYAEATADQSIAEPTMNVHLTGAVQQALNDLRDYNPDKE